MRTVVRLPSSSRKCSTTPSEYRAGYAETRAMLGASTSKIERTRSAPVDLPGGQYAGDERDARGPSELSRGRVRGVCGRREVVAPFEFALLRRAEVGEPVVVHHPRVDVRPVNLCDGLPFAKVQVAELDKRRLVAAPDDLARFGADGQNPWTVCQSEADRGIWSWPGRTVPPCAS